MYKRQGQPTNAIFGFLNILNKLLDDSQPDALCVTFDRAAPTFRHLAYEGYKATRKGMPDELASQLPLLKQVLGAMNIPMYELDGWEADDLIGTISVKDRAAGWETIIVTGDKDSLQLVTDTTTVKLVSTRMGRTDTRDMTPASFREEYGFDPVSYTHLDVYKRQVLVIGHIPAAPDLRRLVYALLPVLSGQRHPHRP